MLIITQGRLNVLVCTLTEKKQSSTKIYLLEFVSQQTVNSKFYCIGIDVSTSPQRYNQFCVTETSGLSGGTNPFDSEILLALSGSYFYNIYEDPNSVLSPVGLHQVETGKMLVIANRVQATPAYTSNANPNLQVYNKENYL